MPIKFKCSGCGQVLQVGDEAAGKKAKCPKCHNVVTIPTPDLVPLESPEDKDDWPGWDELGPKTANLNPFQAPAAPSQLPRTSMGGPALGGGKIVNVPVEIGSIVNYAFEVWKRNLGMLVGALVVMMVIGGVLGGGSNIMIRVLAEAGLRDAVIPFALLVTVARFCIEVFLTAGYWQMLLKMARRQRVEFADLFSAGPIFLPALGISILFGLAVSFGLVLCIVPGVLVILFWWPSYYLVIDRKASVMESFTVAREITANNIGTSFLMILVSLGIVGLGLLACCVGVIVAAPLSSMVTAVGYLMMSGQLPVNPAQYASK
jgi:uncharacterized membrane protein